MGQVFQSQNPGTQVSYFMALKWTNIHKKFLIWKNIYKTYNFSHKRNLLIILIKNLKSIGHEARQTDESGKFLIIEVCLGIG